MRCTRFWLHGGDAVALLDAFDDEPRATSVAAHALRADEAPGEGAWCLEVLHAREEDAAVLAARLKDSLGASGARFEREETAAVPEQDWLLATQRAFPPLRIGRFYLYGAHVRPEPPEDALPIRMDAGTAFGSGEHPTTQGCLLTLGRLDSAALARPVLDLGCGSGVLGIAAAKLGATRVVAADIDPRAVAMTAEYAARNGVAERLTALESDGFGDPRLERAAPYGLVLANILADPLVALAPALSESLAEEGRVVLSGLLSRQAERVLDAYRAVGLVEIDRETVGDWPTLTVARGRGEAAPGG